MKKTFTLFLFATISITLIAQDITSACGTDVSRNYISSKDYILKSGVLANTCVDSDKKFSISTGDKLTIGAGFTRNKSHFEVYSTAELTIEGTFVLDEDLTIQGIVRVKDGGIINTATAKKIVVSNGGQLIVEPGGAVTCGDLTVNTGAVTIASSATLNCAVLTNFSNGVVALDGTLNCTGVVHKGPINGTGTWNFSGVYSNNSSGKVNGVNSMLTTPVNLTSSSSVHTWDGNAWSPSNPASFSDRAVIADDYTTSTNNGLLVAGQIIVNAGISLIFDNSDDLGNVTNFINNGVVEFVDNVKLPPHLLVQGTGTITIKRTIKTLTTGYVRMGFPVREGTCADLVATGFNINLSATPANTIRVWNSSASTWDYAADTTLLSGNSFAIFTGNTANSGRSISLPDMLVSSFNNSNLSQVVSYNNGTGGTFEGSAKDGWNQLYNPFEAYLDWDLVAPKMTVPGTFQQSAVYVWDGSEYITWNIGGSSAAQYIEPHQAFFVQLSNIVTTTFSFTYEMRTASPGTTVSTFKTNTAGQNVVLNLVGDGKTARTEVVLNTDATTSFDANFDAYYLVGAVNHPVLFTEGTDSVKYSLNQFPLNPSQSLALGFEYSLNNKQFTISLDQNLASAVSFIMLEDLFTQALTDLKNSDYTFTSNTQAPTQRFKLHFSQSSIGIAELENGSKLKVWVSGNTLHFNEAANLDGATITVFNTNGQLIASGNSDEPMFINQAGVYIVNVQTKEGRTYNVKVVKM